MFSELNLLVLSTNLGKTLVDHSVMGIGELSKHVPINPGIASMDVVLSQVKHLVWGSGLPPWSRLPRFSHNEIIIEDIFFTSTT